MPNLYGSHNLGAGAEENVVADHGGLILADESPASTNRHTLLHDCILANHDVGSDDHTDRVEQDQSRSNLRLPCEIRAAYQLIELLDHTSYETRVPPQPLRHPEQHNTSCAQGQDLRYSGR